MKENLNPDALVAQILAWYDENARDLPWRIPPAQSRKGILADPYHVWLSEVMLQQTTVAAVKAYYAHFTTRWHDVAALAAAQDNDVMGAWAGLGYYARARNLLKTARIVAREYDGAFPNTEKDLLKLPGVGAYTAAAISSIAFGRRAVVIDGNVKRVMARLFCIQTPLQKADEEIKQAAQSLTPDSRAGDYAQALMDLGATVCTTKSPDCTACPWRLDCRAYAKGCARDLPRKLPKAAKPTRQAIAYIALRNDNAILLEHRPDKGLLGGMLGFPATPFVQTPPIDCPPLDAHWIVLNETVTHVFTHFKLEMQLRIAKVGDDVMPKRGEFVFLGAFNPKSLPTVMAKAWRIARGVLD